MAELVSLCYTRYEGLKFTENPFDVSGIPVIIVADAAIRMNDKTIVSRQFKGLLTRAKDDSNLLLYAFGGVRKSWIKWRRIGFQNDEHYLHFLLAARSYLQFDIMKTIYNME